VKHEWMMYNTSEGKNGLSPSCNKLLNKLIAKVLQLSRFLHY